MDGLDNTLKRIQNRKPLKGIHSALHQLIAELRKEFGETATKGKGSFGFYLGMLGRFSVQELYQIRAEIRQSGAHTPKKLFWWRIGQEMKRKRKNLSRAENPK